MHFFMHGGHGHHHGGPSAKAPRTIAAAKDWRLVMHDSPAYGLWTLVVLNSAIFIIFAFSFFKPQTARDWRTGAFAAFIVALFVEMYGFPLTIYLMSGWLQTKFPSLDLLSHNTGHAVDVTRRRAIHTGVLHIASYVFLGFGFYLLSSAWNVLPRSSESRRVRPVCASAIRSTLRSYLFCWAFCSSGRRC
jgi:hypothetical protein